VVSFGAFLHVGSAAAFLVGGDEVPSSSDCTILSDEPISLDSALPMWE